MAFPVAARGRITQRGKPELLANLLTYWPLDEMSGSRVDVHGGYTLSEVGTLGYGGGLAYPNAALYDMTADNALTRSLASCALINFSQSTPFTIAAWLYLTAESGGPDTPAYYRSILNINGGSAFGGGYTIHTTAGRQIYCVLGNTGGTAYNLHTGHFLALNTWQLFAWTHNAGSLMYYLDGATVTDENAIGFAAASAGNFYVGIKAGASYVFDGRMGPVMMFNRALATSELNWLYNGGLGRTYEVLV